MRNVGLVRVVAGAGLAFLAASAASATPPRCDRCKDLPRLEQELFEQEWLQHEFHEYALGNKTPPAPAPGKSSSDALRNRVLRDFLAWQRSPAGAGGSRGGAPELGTDWSNCTLTGYKAVVTKNKQGKVVKREYQEIPFDEQQYRAKNCTELADYLIAHEQKHVEQCRKYGSSTRVDLSYWLDYAAFDTEAYGAGIRNLRATIAKLARSCGWQGSTAATKPNPEDGFEEDVVPTMAEAKQLAKALKTASKP